MSKHRSLSAFNDRNTCIDGKRHVVVNECTLREGEQSPLVNFRPEQKIKYARKLCEVGISRIQVGYPGLSVSDFEVIRRLKKSKVNAVLEAVVLGYLPNWAEQLEAAKNSGADSVGIVYVTSKPRYEKIFKVNQAEIKEVSKRLIQKAKEAGLEVAFAPADSTRTDINFLLEMVQLGEAAGADRIFIGDTVGAATPGAIRWLIKNVRSVTQLPVQYHGHNDFGLALANSLSAVEAGATLIDTTLNGWGDRTGMPATEEFAAIMELLYSNPVGIDLVGITQVAKEIATELNISIPPTKPISGSLAFAQKLETHVKAALEYPPAFEAFDPTLVGGKRHVAIGQYSGPEALRARMEHLGVYLGSDSLLTFVEKVQISARETNKVLGDEELLTLARQCVKDFRLLDRKQ